MRGDRRDANGPFLARELLACGADPGRIVVVGDRPDELEAALSEGLEADLCVVSGGLGPTHDDRTVELLARVAGRELAVHRELEAEIEAVSRRIAERLRRPYADFRPGVRKQASLPAGAVSLGLAGTAPGIVLDTGESVVVVLPGPPSELRRLWPEALASEPVRRVLERARPRRRAVMRFFGVSESAVAQALAGAGGEGEGVEATVCASEFEIRVDLIVDERAERRAAEIVSALRGTLEPYLFAEDEQRVEEIVLELCRARGLTIAAAESCTGGLVAARLTAVPGASDAFLGGIVAYGNAAKREQLGVPADVLARDGAVSAAAAAAMATGARAALAADVGISVTGIAGPGGGSPEKPVGLVYIHVEGPAGAEHAELNVPGDRELIRGRATAFALHLTRRLLTQSRHHSV